jgi:hypothetical protein
MGAKQPWDDRAAQLMRCPAALCSMQPSDRWILIDKQQQRDCNIFRMIPRE